jgi:leader peptidase (prepilin peptidase)/N-methyltransferase
MLYAIFIFGLFLGSFLNCVALRLETNEKIILKTRFSALKVSNLLSAFSRSKCPKCNKILKWHNLIPVLSFVLQRGKCQNCSQKISIRYPLVEIFMGLIVYGLAQTIAISNFQSPISIVLFIYYLVFLASLLVLALIDLKTKYIDERIIYFAVIFWLILQLVSAQALPQFGLKDLNIAFSNTANGFLKSAAGFINQLYIGFLATLPFLFLFLITLGRGVGLGDVKVAFVMGLFLKPGDLILSFLFTLILGGIASIFILIKNKKFKQEIPYVPFLFLGTLTAMFWGEKIISYYFKIFQ